MNRSIITDDEILKAIQGLYSKIFLHCASIYYLFRGVSVPELRFGNHIDPASINVLSRAATEAFLALHYNFVSPDSAEEQKLRYYAWVLKDLHQRQEYQPITQEGRNQLLEEKREIDNIRQYVINNKSFLKLTAKQKRVILDKGEWPLWSNSGARLSLVDIGIGAGIHKSWMAEHYSYASSHVHAGYWSIRQLNAVTSYVDERTMSEGTFYFLAIIIAHALRYCFHIFPDGPKHIQEFDRINRLVEDNIAVGAMSPEVLDDARPSEGF